METDIFEAAKKLEMKGRSCLIFGILGILAVLFLTGLIRWFIIPIFIFLIFFSLFKGRCFLKDRIKLLTLMPSDVELCPGLTYSIILLSSILISMIIIFIFGVVSICVSSLSLGIVVIFFPIISLVIGLVIGISILRKQKLDKEPLIYSIRPELRQTQPEQLGVVQGFHNIVFFALSHIVATLYILYSTIWLSVWLSRMHW